MLYIPAAARGPVCTSQALAPSATASTCLPLRQLLVYALEHTLKLNHKYALTCNHTCAHTQVVSDGSSLGSDWFLDYVIVTNATLGTKVKFPFKNWLDTKNGLSHILAPEGMEGDTVGVGLLNYSIHGCVGCCKAIGVHALCVRAHASMCECGQGHGQTCIRGGNAVEDASILGGRLNSTAPYAPCNAASCLGCAMVYIHGCA